MISYKSNITGDQKCYCSLYSEMQNRGSLMIPLDDNNLDYQDYLAWVARGNPKPSLNN